MMSVFEKKVFQCMHETDKSPDEAVWYVLHTQSIAESEHIAQRNDYFTLGIQNGFLTAEDVYKLEQSYQKNRYGGQ